MLTTLAELLAPVSLPIFLEAVGSKRRFHVKATDPRRAEALLPWEEIERLTSTPSILAEASIMKDGMVVPQGLYSSNGALDVRAFHDILGQGASVLLFDIKRWAPAIERLAVSIERELGVNTSTNAYLSVSKGGAFRPHWDRHDVLLVQIHGKKQWRLWDAPVVDPVQRSSESKYVPATPPVFEAEFSPGDVFFIPRGHPHAAAVSGESSVHVTFGLNTLKGIDFVQHLRTVAEDDEFLRGSLPLAVRTSAAALRGYEDELKRRLHQLIDETSVSDFLRQDDVKRAPSERTWLTSAAPRPGDILRLTLRRRVPLPSDDTPVMIGGKAIAMTAAARAVIGWLFDHERSSRAAVTDALIPAHAPADIEEALLQLMQSGFVLAERAV